MLNKSSSRTALQSRLIRLMIINGIGVVVTAGNARYVLIPWGIGFVAFLAIFLINFSCLQWLTQGK